MRRMRALTVAALFTLIGVIGVAAQSPTIPGPVPPNPNPQDVTLVGAGPTHSVISNIGPGSTALDVFVGPYQLAFTTGSYASQPFDVYCVDYTHDVNKGDTWDAYFTDLASGDLGKTRLGSAGVTQYQEAAWLAMQFSSNPTGSWAAIHSAIWRIISGNNTIGTNLSGVSTWVTRATTAADKPDLSNIVVISDVQTGTKQEYIAFTHSYVTPEPMTLLLLGTGMLGLLLFAGYRRFA